MNDSFGSLEIRWIKGFTNQNLEFVDNETVCYTCGSHICFLNLETKKQSVFQSPGRGASVLTANGNTGIFAFSEEKLTPSIFVFTFPELQLKNALKGTAQLDYKSLTLSDGGPYLGCCSTLPDYTITVWNWETAEPLCAYTQAGQDVISLVFNPLNWFQLCAFGKSSLTVWNIEKSASIHVLKPSVIELPAADGSIVERLRSPSPTANLEFTYFVPEMPPSAIMGLRGDGVLSYCHTELYSKPRLTPTAICWTTTSNLYVGCEEGFLLLVDPESLTVSVLFNPTTADDTLELKQNKFLAFAFHRNALIAAGEESVVYNLQIQQAQIVIKQMWHLEGPVTTVMFSPDHETLLFSSDMGQIYTLHPTHSEDVVKILDVGSSNFVAAAFLQSDQSICVSVRETGDLQLWSAEGICLSSLSLQAEVTSLACCPIVPYAAVGTASGNVLWIDLSREQQPRLVHQAHLYDGPVNHLIFDQDGHFLLTGAPDPHVYVLEAKPAKRFSIIGYTAVPGPVLSLSTQNLRESEQVQVLALCTGQEGKTRDSTNLTLFTLSLRDLAGPDCVDQDGCVSDHVLKVSKYEMPHPVNSCVLGVSDIYAYCHRRRTLQQYQLPQDPKSLSRKQGVELKQVQEVKGHPLGPASLALSPDQLCLASWGRDGLLRIQDTTSLECYIEQQCHSSRLNGVRSVSFSADSQTLLTVGFKVSSLVCTDLRLKGLDFDELNKSTQSKQTMRNHLTNTASSETLALMGLHECGQQSSIGTEKPEDSKTAKEENLQYIEKRENMKERLKEICDIIQEMIHENDNVPEIEHLDLREFNVNIEEQRRLAAMIKEEVTRVRQEITLGTAERSHQCDVIRREFWDSMKVKGRAVKAFHSEHEVKNYPLKERTEKELENLRNVENIRMLEKAACTLSSQKQSSSTTSDQDQELEEETNEASESTEVTDSYSVMLGCSHPDMYNQFIVQTTEQRINQIILLQDVIYRLKTAFNVEFNAVHKQKVQEIDRVRDRNRQIKEITSALEMDVNPWEPDLTDRECPERLFSVADSEIKAEKYLTPEQRKEEERKELEEQKRVVAKGDNVRGRALDDMMEGALKMKKGDFLKMEIPLPEFALTKPDREWSPEEKKVFQEYEKKAKELSAEKEKYKKSLEIEMKKLQEANKDATELFDETLKKLFERKIKFEMAINQEELKIAHLDYSVHMEGVMGNQERELKLKLDKMLAYKNEAGEKVKTHEREVELFQEIYDSVVAEDKVLDEEFRKSFPDVPRPVVNRLYKLFKRRPRNQKMHIQTSNPNPEQIQRASPVPGGLGKIAVGMEELDAPTNMPEGLNLSIWERFCLIRGTKVLSEQKVRETALTLAEMKAFLLKRRDEDEAAQKEIKRLTTQLERVHEERNRLLLDTMVQVLLKQGQVEVSATELARDYSDSVLLSRTVVDDLNTKINALGEQKIARMVKTKDLRTGIIRQEWENKKKKMQKEDLENKARDIQKLHLTEDHKEYLNKTDRDCRVTRQVSTLRDTIAFQEKTHQKNIQKRLQKIKHYNRQAAVEEEKKAKLEEEIQEMQVTVSEMKHISGFSAAEENEAAKTEERYQEMLQRKKLKDTARSQEEQLAVLTAEVERLRMRNFPSLDQLKHD
ncbi:cilia- and flagella-associated protein 43 [Aulostomus maculatus]